MFQCRKKNKYLVAQKKFFKRFEKNNIFERFFNTFIIFIFLKRKIISLEENVFRSKILNAFKSIAKTVPKITKSIVKISGIPFIAFHFSS